MSFRGRGGGGGFRGRGGGSFRGGNRGMRGGGGRGGGRQFDTGPPESVVEFAVFTHTCEDQLVLKCVDPERVPWFNAGVYLENIQQVGKVDEIFGSIRNHSVSVKLSDEVKASSFKLNQKLFIDPYKLFPLQKFLDPSSRGRGRGGGRGGGGRGGDRGRGGGGRGARGRGSFGGGRGGFGDRGRGRGFDRGGRGRGGGGFQNNFSPRGRGGFQQPPAKRTKFD